ncbi:hypothetical protein L208DRAFT_154973 [Tricholoma matsutake]|nr:hypothetical protein L208DRAFT_154973 [Tricholoma matsutake 945]
MAYLAAARVFWRPSAVVSVLFPPCLCRLRGCVSRLHPATVICSSLPASLCCCLCSVSAVSLPSPWLRQSSTSCHSDARLSFAVVRKVA